MQTLRIGSNISEEAKVSLIILLKQYSKVFVWKPTNMTGIDHEVVEHNLNIILGALPSNKKEGASG